MKDRPGCMPMPTGSQAEESSRQAGWRTNDFELSAVRVEPTDQHQPSAMDAVCLRLTEDVVLSITLFCDPHYAATYLNRCSSCVG
ncbi:MAG TPA: hypothetical protein VFM48_06955 [Aquabacterium sp.]|nr:hypothetical protein [Aquabacterium sp.]